jgi:superfamily I DNA/RNA helicase
MSEKPLFSRGKYSPLAAESAMPKDLQDSSFEGGLLILGSPGSGKTTLLRLIAREQISRLGPNAVLAITPDRQSAALRRDELILDSLISSAGPRARSVTGLAFWILDQTALAKGESRPKLLSGANQQELVASLVTSAIAQGKEKNWKLPKATLQLNGFVTELRDQLTVFLEHQILPEALASLAKDFPDLRLGPALDIYPAYLEEIQKLGVLDTSQLLVRATQQIKADRSLLSDLKLVLIDDAQELTAAGFALVEELSTTITTVFFADPDATVLGFRGALGSKLSAELERVFPKLSRHTLETKHEIRSAEIAELLRRISNRIPVSLAGSQRKSLNHSVSKPESVTSKVFPNSSQELDYLATEIRRTRLTESASWDDFVVVARTRPQLDAIQKGLVARGVPSRILGAQTALREQFAARSILDIALKILKPDLNDESLSRALLQSPFCGLDSLGLRRLFRKLAHLERESGLVRSQKVLLSEVIETAAAVDLDTPEFLKLKKLQTLIRSVREKPSGNALQLVSRIWENSGLASKWQEIARGSSEVAAAANRDLDSVLELFAAAERYTERNPAATALDFVSNQLEVAVPEDSLAPLGYSPSVSLSTPSALLGSRYRFGFLPRLQDGIWPNLRSRSSLLGATAIDEYLKGNSEDPNSLSRTELSEELRLLFKAVGSITERAYFTAMQSLDEQPSQFFNILFSHVPAVENYEREFDLRNRVGRLRIAVQAGDEKAALELATLAQAGMACLSYQVMHP